MTAVLSDKNDNKNQLIKNSKEISDVRTLAKAQLIFLL
jgi:hypothetical protein